jgi:ABC-type multidrug transport system permease subunit
MGLLKGSEMNKAGGIVGIFGILLLFAMIALLYTMKFFSTVHTSQVEITTALSALV